jgi:hypothetical protein
MLKRFNMILNEFLNFSTPIGFKRPQQLLERSPGRISTCFEYKQYGQWSRAVELAGSTFLWHFSHTKDSLIMLKRFS